MFYVKLFFFSSLNLVESENAPLITAIKMSDSSDSEEEMVPGLVMANGKENLEDEEEEGEGLIVRPLGDLTQIQSYYRTVPSLG